MSTSIVKIENLSHRYTKAWAIKDINLEIKNIGVTGLLGSNGAGKSTTMNILCGVLNQTQGRVLIDGIDLRAFPLEAKKLIGFLPQNAPLYLDLTVDEYLRHCAYMRRIPDGQVKQAMEEAKERCGVAHFSKRLLKNLSGGYKQRVGIAQAIIHKPKMVVLDEPTNGLDPNQIAEVRELIKEIGSDRCVIFSSHILSEVQATCDSIRMIEQGQVVFNGTVDDFNNYIAPSSMVLYLNNPPAEAALLAVEGVTQVKTLDKHRVRVSFEAEPSIAEKIVSLSVSQGWRLQELHLERSSLEEIFARLSNKVK
ncbi:ABC-2 type transport system ATP-binding protein [Filimonas lacunae]|uniref:ABC-2 type transport system ATP-binding protein n=1 Tax=Filimonas lacunae TaxID=477680 RepID=A0A173MN72_9BACT|nr:ABC transporter ATP-binding protein [Filimonas lacunae]BAV08919.1 ABC transporter, ATP-binding protein [Filimonas lacunae]SIS64017.1 ABC-2 type transport system ATP-binding protein [Filimonas lacunae]